MKEVKEPEIKLFGRTIVFPENGGVVASGESSAESCDESNSGSGVVVDWHRCLEVISREEEDGEKSVEEKQPQSEGQSAGEFCETKPQDMDFVQNQGAGEESENPNSLSGSNDNPKTPSIDEDVMSENDPKSENEQSDGQQKGLKKPDKILPCPRCKSMDTKFCYYNNYNVKQPRHFCKSCQRYWTAGGTMRNVPVGAGRRKNKNSTSHYRHITISEALQAARIHPPNGFHHPTSKPNGTVLSFGPDSNGDDCSIGSSATTLNSMADGGKNGLQQPVMQNINAFPSPVPCISGVPWPFPWNSAFPLPAICPPGYPMPFYPAPYWNFPWLPMPSPTANQNATGSSLNSTLGKHSRNGELLKTNNSEGKEHVEPKNSESSIVVPKTLRIDDPEEAAKSSIWQTLGIKYDSISREGLFKALQPKGDEKKLLVSSSPVLQANPAALSRSITFREGV